ncbi:MAG: type IV pilus modification protein PilV [Tepidimonas sp.]|uniref:type IV pilus modification protein PilV n=1 Tax=Tepidimonas sp. TaxID=2002775 RepID=UPI004054E8AF
MNTAATHDPPKRQRGAGLVEIMIAVVILSIGIIGIVRLQLAAMRNADSAYLHTQSSLLIYDILDAMRADRTAALAHAYDLPKTCQRLPPGNTLATRVHSAWIASIKQALGDHAGTCGEIWCDQGLCRIRIYWNDERATNGSAQTWTETRSRL